MQFIERYCKAKNRAWKETKRYFDREILPQCRGRSVHEITSEDVEDLIDGVAEERPIAANRLLAVVRKWYAWMGGKYRGGQKATLKARLRNSPCTGIEAPGKESKRDVTDPEIKALTESFAADGRLGNTGYKEHL